MGALAASNGRNLFRPGHFMGTSAVWFKVGSNVDVACCIVDAHFVGTPGVFSGNGVCVHVGR
jgi:hypothetical protein